VPPGGLLAKGAGRFFGAIAKDAEGQVASSLEEAGAKVESDLGGGACAKLSFSPDTLVATPTGETPIAAAKAGNPQFHHMPQNALLGAFGITRREGLALAMDATEHGATRG
jgi:hypothetical protein